MGRDHRRNAPLIRPTSTQLRQVIGAHAQHDQFGGLTDIAPRLSHSSSVLSLAFSRKIKKETVRDSIFDSQHTETAENRCQSIGNRRDWV